MRRTPWYFVAPLYTAVSVAVLGIQCDLDKAGGAEQQSLRQSFSML